ncbi:MAG: MoaD/ThiS family protein [Gemmatimonadetes bacterium]|nr:MoaD/ThiS family protein [Gemmatimonadota bacterium]
MAVTLTLPTVLANLAEGNKTLEAEGHTLGDAIDNVSGRYPQLASRLRDEDGTPYPFVTFYLNDQDIRLNGGFDVELHEGDEITIVPAIAGG